MRLMLAFTCLCSLMLVASGCAMCCAPYDCDYLYCGGRWVRNNPSSGRVGSVFDEAGAPVDATPTAAAAPTPAPLPTQSVPGTPTRSVIPRNLGDNYLP
jgi:hypothetical protein